MVLNKIKKLRKEGLSFSQISKELNIPKTTVFRWFKKSNKPRKEKIKLICKTCKKSFFVPFCRKNTAKYCSKECVYEDLKKRYKGTCLWKGKYTPSRVKIKINCIECGKEFVRRGKNNKYCSLKCMGLAERKKIKNKQLDDNLAYILGVLKGDGFLRGNSTGLLVKDEDFVDTFLKRVEQWSGYTPIKKINIRGKYIKVILHSKEIYNFLKEFDINRVLENPDYVVKFVEGFFDSEGTVNKSNNVISVYNTNLALILFVKRCLSILGIESKLYKIQRDPTRKMIYNLSLTSSKFQKKFASLINSSIQRKQKRLNKILLGGENRT